MQKRSINRSPRRAAQGGFSLIEIIVVVVLMGGIVAFAASRIMGGGDRAKVRLAEAHVQTLAEKVNQFEMDAGTLPGALSGLGNDPGGLGGWVGPYANAGDLDDPWNTPFEYRVPATTARTTSSATAPTVARAARASMRTSATNKGAPA